MRLDSELKSSPLGTSVAKFASAFAMGALLFASLAVEVAYSEDADSAKETSMPNKAVAQIRGASGTDVTGKVRFDSAPGGTTIVVDLQNLPSGKSLAAKGEGGKEVQHAMHIHQFGDCSAPDASSAGPHFNPHGHKHGGPASDVNHLGDLENITASENGIAQHNFIDRKISLTGPHSIIGRAVVIHERADDFQTDPAGNSGARIGCGVIGLASE